MAENLRVENYTGGTPIDQITNNTIWSGLSAGTWCYYDNNPGLDIPYGKLYNWFAVSGDCQWNHHSNKKQGGAI